MMRRRAALGILGVTLLGLTRRGRADEDNAATLLQESLGGLKIKLPADQLKPLIGNPSRRGKEWLAPASGEYEERWEYSARGLAITLSGPKSPGAKTVCRIEAFAPCKLATQRGIRLGSPIADVRRAYGRDLFKDDGAPAPPRLVVGSRYGGLLFDLTAGKVSRIYLGSFAD